MKTFHKTKILILVKQEKDQSQEHMKNYLNTERPHDWHYHIVFRRQNE